MILIAIPKSASTSLMKTLSKIHSIKGVQLFQEYRNNDIPEDSNFLHKIHSDIKELTDKDVENFENANILFKQHVFPSAGNIKKLGSHKKVVLLREVDDILLAYKRGAKTMVQNLLEGFDANWTDKQWLDHSEKIGLRSDLNKFYQGWVNFKDDDNTIIIEYKDLLNSPKLVVNQVEDFLGLPKTADTIYLVKARYSRASKAELFFQHFKKFLARNLIYKNK
tara:strand:- start:6797 stop:7462 length:666 start_codon:yes stop_codon:yes gene_type:complete